MEDFIERPVVSVSLVVELGSFKVAMTMGFVDLRTEDPLVHTKFCAVRETSRVKNVKISTESTDTNIVNNPHQPGNDCGGAVRS